MSLQLAACVTRWWEGQDNAGEQKKIKARKMLENAARTRQSGAAVLGGCFSFTTFCHGFRVADGVGE
jgi:hypothetical protein